MDDLAPSKAQIIEATIQRASARPGGFLTTFREALEINSVGKDPEGRRAKFTDRFRPLSPMAGHHPNSLAALEIHRWDTTFGGPRSPKLRKCARENRLGKRCGAVAIRGSRFCRLHGGAKVKEERLRRKFRDYRPDRAALGATMLRQIVRMGRLPYELVRDVPEFREVYARARHGISSRDERFAEWTYGERRLHHEACVMLTLAYLAAWEAMRVRGDWNPWADCTRRAAQLGLVAA